MIPIKLTGAFILFLTCIGIKCQSGESGFEPPQPTRTRNLRHILARDIMRRLFPGRHPDFIRATPRDSRCPLGFQYVHMANTCYMIIDRKYSWTSAGQRCRHFHPKAHLVAIAKKEENIALKIYLLEELAKNSHLNPCTFDSSSKGLWTSGHRLIETQCKEPFFWKISKDTKLPLSYSHWKEDEPDCVENVEQCIHVIAGHDFRWNEMNCKSRLCPLCEYDLS